MRRLFQSDVFKICLFVAGSIVLGAALAPWIYNFGMGIAEVTQGKDTNGVIEWLGAAARRSKDNFPRFFDRSVLFSALVLLGPLLWWLRLDRGRAGRAPWKTTLPEEATGLPGQPLQKNPKGWIQLVSGFAIAAGLLLLAGFVLVKAGYFILREAPVSARGVTNPLVQEIDWLAAIRRSLPTAAVVALIEEWLFRGVLLGIFLRAMKPAAANVSVSLLFAFVHFLEPPPGSVVPDPEAYNAGFVLLGQILGHLANPAEMIGRFATLVVVGMILAAARWRTASLWLPIGLHAGWIFAYQLFKAATWPSPELPESAHWWVGPTLMEGLAPLMVALLTGMLVVVMTPPRDEAPGHG